MEPVCPFGAAGRKTASGGDPGGDPCVADARALRGQVWCGGGSCLLSGKHLGCTPCRAVRADEDGYGHDARQRGGGRPVPERARKAGSPDSVRVPATRRDVSADVGLGVCQAGNRADARPDWRFCRCDGRWFGDNRPCCPCPWPNPCPRETRQSRNASADRGRHTRLGVACQVNRSQYSRSHGTC